MNCILQLTDGLIFFCTQARPARAPPAPCVKPCTRTLPRTKTARTPTEPWPPLIRNQRVLCHRPVLPLLLQLFEDQRVSGQVHPLAGCASVRTRASGGVKLKVGWLGGRKSARKFASRV
jgi:hypothetical protein